MVVAIFVFFSLSDRATAEESRLDEVSLLLQQEKFEDAVKILEQERKSATDPTDRLAATGMLGDVLMRLYRVDEAVGCFRDLVNLHPQNGFLRFKLGNALSLQISTMNDAISELQQARSLGYENPDVLYKIGFCCKVLGENATDSVQRDSFHGEAEKNLKALLQEEPDHLAGIGNLADLYFNLGKFDRALDLYKQVRKLQPKNPVLIPRLAHTMMMAGNATESITLLKDYVASQDVPIATGTDKIERIMQLEMTSSGISYLIEALYRTGNTSEAIPYVRRLKDITDPFKNDSSESPSMKFFHEKAVELLEAVEGPQRKPTNQ